MADLSMGKMCFTCGKPLYLGDLLYRNGNELSHTLCVLTLTNVLVDDIVWCSVCKKTTLQADLLGCCDPNHKEKQCGAVSESG